MNRNRTRIAGATLAAFLGSGLLTSGHAKYAATLVIEHQAVASWLPICNAFAIGHIDADGDGQVDDPDRWYWTGVLFQLGAHADPEHSDHSYPQYLGVILYDKDGNIVAAYDTSAVRWFNIRAAEPGGAAQADSLLNAPLERDHAYMLYPNQRADFDACSACQTKDCETSPGDLHERCVRDRRIHNNFIVRGLITYWQGANGFSLESKQEVGQGEYDNLQSFSLKDPVRVDVWKHVNPTTLELEKEHDLGVVTRIVVTWDPPGPKHGIMQDPPWPGP